MKSVFRLLVHLTWMLALACGAVLTWALWIEDSFLTYRDLPFPALAHQVRAGGVVPITVHRCSSDTRERVYGVTRELRNQNDPKAGVVVMPPSFTSIKPGCEVATSLLNEVPLNTPPGIYQIQGLGVTRGAIREFAVPWFSQSFEVVE